jgi:hypothetical protein
MSDADMSQSTLPGILDLVSCRTSSDTAMRFGQQEASTSGMYLCWTLKRSSLLTRCRIPMVAPFCGCAFGGLLYDVFIYTGPCPINTEWLGLKDIIHPRHAIEERIRAQKKEGLV